MSARPTARINTRNANHFVQIGSTWRFAHNLESVTFPEAAPTTSEQATLTNGTYSTSTPAGPQNPTINYSGFNSNLEGHAEIQNAGRAGRKIRSRTETIPETIISQTSGGVTVAISTAGAVTFAGTDPDFTGVLVGHCIQVGGALHVIQAADSSGKPTRVTAPDSAVSASAYSILNPIYRSEWFGVPSKPGRSYSSGTPVVAGSTTYALESDADFVDFHPVTTATPQS